jgi:hypothetical protein
MAAETPAWFPILSTPDSRRGAFAKRVVEAERNHLIHPQVAASWLCTTEAEYAKSRAHILQMF